MSDTTWTIDEVHAWFRTQIPAEWFSQPPDMHTDRDEIILVGTLTTAGLADTVSGDDRAAAEADCIAEFRERTREQRVSVAQQAEARWGRKVSWATRCGKTHVSFTSANVPVMTRLRLEERQVLDTLIDSGVARSRSEALGWCVRLVARHEGEWIDRLREAMTEVERIRAEGPG